MTQYHWGGKRRLVIVHHNWEGSLILPPNGAFFVWMQNNTPHYSETMPWDPTIDQNMPQVTTVTTNNKQILTINGFEVTEIYKERGLG